MGIFLVVAFIQIISPSGFKFTLAIIHSYVQRYIIIFVHPRLVIYKANLLTALTLTHQVCYSNSLTMFTAS